MKSLFVAFFLLSSLAIRAQGIVISGTMHHTTLEGGCWYLENGDGKRFELTGDTALLRVLRVDGQHVVVRAEPVKNGASVCMLGEIMRVTQRIDTLRYPIDLAVTTMMVDGKISRTKSGVWYVKMVHGERLEFQQPPAKKYRHAGAQFHKRVRVLQDKKSTREHMDGVILPESKPMRERAMPKKYDPR